MDGAGETQSTDNQWPRQLLGLVLGPLAVYAYAIYISWWGQTGDAAPDNLLGWVYATAFYAVGLAGWLFLVYRFVCRRSLRQLNRRPGTVLTDLVHGLVLAGVLYAANSVLGFLNIFLWLGESGQVENIYAEVMQDPWAVFMLLGPYTFLAAAMYEEFLRVFLLDRALALWPGRRVLWLIIGAAGLLFGLCHIYQGLYGVVNSISFGLLFAGYYCTFGRVLPLMIAHGVYNFIVISMGLILTALGIYS